MRNTVDDAQLICETFNRNTRILLLKPCKCGPFSVCDGPDRLCISKFLRFFHIQNDFFDKMSACRVTLNKNRGHSEKWPAKERFWELCQSQVHIGNVFLKKETAHNTNVLFEWKEKFFSLIITGVKTLSKKLLTQFF